MRKRIIAGGVIAALTLSIFAAAQYFRQSAAASPAQWDPGFIISDAQFYSATAMTADSIQSFLADKGKSCQAGTAPCLKDYTQDTQAMAADSYCKAYQGGTKQSAAKIIWDVAQACGINPKVLLVTLQKETALVTGTKPSTGSYQIAMGYGCPDGAACDSAYYGFFNQIYRAARQFQIYAARPASFGYQAGAWNNIRYNPNAACGSSSVYIQNQATASLYNYTPYQPNQAALNNLYGTGDSCSAYGNRNFWALFTDWFGDPRAGTSPFGAVDRIAGDVGAINVQGWAIDPDAPTTPVTIHVYIGGPAAPVGEGHNTGPAEQARPDVATIYPQAGAGHGFCLSITTAKRGVQTVYIYAINVTGTTGDNMLLGTATVIIAAPSAATSNPFGVVDFVNAQSGAISVQGWAIDPDGPATTPLTIHIYVGGPAGAGDGYNMGVTTTARPDVAAVYPNAGLGHGYNFTIPTTRTGIQPVYIYAINAGPTGDNVLLGMRTITLS